MFILSMKCAMLDISIHSDSQITVLQDEVVELIRAATGLNSAVLCDSIECKHIGGPTGDHRYTINTKDGRKWSQVFNFQEPETRMTFDVPDLWKLSEFVAHRPLRDIVTKMTPKFGVDKININFTTT